MRFRCRWMWGLVVIGLVFCFPCSGLGADGAADATFGGVALTAAYPVTPTFGFGAVAFPALGADATPEPSPSEDSEISFAPAYWQSFKGAEADGVLKAMWQFGSGKWGDLKVGWNLDALPRWSGTEKSVVGLGASATFRDALKGLNLGVGWLPTEGWGWNINIFQVELQ